MARRAGLSEITLQQILGELREPLAQQRGSGELIDIWSISGIGRDEVKNCAVLAWLCNPRGSHGLSSLFLRSVLQLSDVPDDTIEDVRVFREHRPLGSDRDRIDVSVELPGKLVFIEVKIGALIGQKQLERYKEAAEDLSRTLSVRQGRLVTPYLIFLAPHASELVHSDFRPLTWKKLATALHEAATQTAPTARTILTSYARHISNFER